MERKDMKLGFIGFGNMAQAIAEGLLRSKALEPEQICACAKDWDKLCAATQPRGMRPCRDAREVAEAADVVIVAVKPHLIEEVLSPVRGQLADKAVVSVAAGWPFERYEALLPGTRHLSTMPNTPVRVCAGVFLLEEKHSLTPEEYVLVQELFGHPICSGDTATKILWLRRHEPEIYAKTAYFLTGSSFLTARLTGKYVIDQALAKGSFRPLYQADGSVNEAECGLYCRPDQIAACAWSTDIVGTVTPEAAAQTGLAAGTPVITGTGDSTAEAISVGLVEPGTAFFQYGSSMFYYYCTDHFVGSYVSPQGNGALKGGKAFTVPGTYCLGDGTNAAGTLTRWVRDLLYSKELEAEKQGGENAYAVMAREAAAVPPGSDGLMMLPYIYGERSPLQDAEATGMLFGLKGTHGRAQINRAALEAVGYSTYQHLLLFEELGVPPRRIITAGGGTKNAAWMQIICDMAGMPLTIPEPFQCSSYGDAMLAAVGVGALESFAALRAALPQGRILQPDRKNHEFYQEHYPIFRDLYLENRDRMHRMQK